LPRELPLYESESGTDGGTDDLPNGTNRC